MRASLAACAAAAALCGCGSNETLQMSVDRAIASTNIAMTAEYGGLSIGLDGGSVIVRPDGAVSVAVRHSDNSITFLDASGANATRARKLAARFGVADMSSQQLLSTPEAQNAVKYDMARQIDEMVAGPRAEVQLEDENAEVP